MAEEFTLNNTLYELVARERFIPIDGSEPQIANLTQRWGRLASERNLRPGVMPQRKYLILIEPSDEKEAEAFLYRQKLDKKTDS